MTDIKFTHRSLKGEGKNLRIEVAVSSRYQCLVLSNNDAERMSRAFDIPSSWMPIVVDVVEAEGKRENPNCDGERCSGTS